MHAMLKTKGTIDHNVCTTKERKQCTTNYRMADHEKTMIKTHQRRINEVNLEGYLWSNCGEDEDLPAEKISFSASNFFSPDVVERSQNRFFRAGQKRNNPLGYFSRDEKIVSGKSQKNNPSGYFD